MVFYFVWRCEYYFELSLLQKVEEWQRKRLLKSKIENPITRPNQWDFIKTVSLLDSEDQELLKTVVKLWLPSKTATIWPELDSILERESHTSSEERTPWTTPDSEFTGVLLSRPTDTSVLSESPSGRTSHQEPWAPKSESCSTQTNPYEKIWFDHMNALQCKAIITEKSLWMEKIWLNLCCFKAFFDRLSFN